jgi:hypothetical protein
VSVKPVAIHIDKKQLALSTFFRSSKSLSSKLLCSVIWLKVKDGAAGSLEQVVRQDVHVKKKPGTPGKSSQLIIANF